MQTAPCYVPSFWHNTGVWWTDRQTDGRTDRRLIQRLQCEHRGRCKNHPGLIAVYNAVYIGLSDVNCNWYAVILRAVQEELQIFYNRQRKHQLYFRPHRSTTYIDAAYCYRPSSVVCRSVCLSQSSALQKRRTDRDAVWVVDSSGLKEPCITWRSWSAAWKWAILGKGASHCKVYGLFAVSYTKTAETIEMPFGMLSRVNPRNHVLDRVQVPHKNGQFWGGGHAQTCQRTLCVSCAKTAEPIEMPFGLWIQVVPGKYVLHREYRLAPPSEYDWTVRVRRRCGHMLITLISCYILTTKFESK